VISPSLIRKRKKPPRAENLILCPVAALPNALMQFLAGTSLLSADVLKDDAKQGAVQDPLLQCSNYKHMPIY
jgi:hypothetical protein